METISMVNRQKIEILICEYKGLIRESNWNPEQQKSFWEERLRMTQREPEGPEKDFYIQLLNFELSEFNTGQQVTNSKRITTYEGYFISQDAINKFEQSLKDANVIDNKGNFKGLSDSKTQEIKGIVYILNEKGFLKKPVIPSHIHLFAIKLGYIKDESTFRKKGQEFNPKSGPDKAIYEAYNKILPLLHYIP